MVRGDGKAETNRTSTIFQLQRSSQVEEQVPFERPSKNATSEGFFFKGETKNIRKPEANSYCKYFKKSLPLFLKILKITEDKERLKHFTGCKRLIDIGN